MAKKAGFEEAITRLEEIVGRLEKGEVPLEESIRLYEEGMKLGKNCRKMLDDAELFIPIRVRPGGQGFAVCL